MDSFRSLLLFFSLLFAVAVSESVLKILPEKQRSGHLLLTSDGNIRKDDELFCESWRYAVETNDAGVWEEIPRRCVRFVDEYMNGSRYASDSDAVAGYSLQRAQGVEIASDGKDVWIFDIDETLLSNLPYYAAHGYGSEAFNETAWNEWVTLAAAPPLPASLRLYKELQRLGFQLILLTGRTEDQRNVTDENLLFAGYSSWDRLILRCARGESLLTKMKPSSISDVEQGMTLQSTRTKRSQAKES
ncbi:acid phosphatase 1-like isoform X2 [Magnolia sinica]|uniref:acid phosphatase 1-like isoform X2 n=1 Tax=Magnolia sinica TaxID=86752 RepID=UPI00265ABDB6|nr:acid phosphatase 1-like isoform X2 [Magnolia sinica]